MKHPRPLVPGKFDPMQALLEESARPPQPVPLQIQVRVELPQLEAISVRLAEITENLARAILLLTAPKG
jgi:hypothetical protein